MHITMSDNGELSAATQLSAADQQEIMYMMTQFFDEHEACHEREASECGASQHQASPQLPAVSESSTHIKASDIGFFYPNMPYKWGDSDIIDWDGKNYYRNVYNFTNWIRVAAQTCDQCQLKQSLDSCLHGEAELWWNNQLNNILRTGYITTHGVEDFCKALEA